MYRRAYTTLWSLAFLFAATPSAHAAVCFVATTGSSGNAGDGWASPYDLQTALGTPACTEIWVMEGVYKPTSGTDATISFRVSSGTAVYGGFAGTESSRGQRNAATNATVLSGDLNGDDTGAINGVDPGVPTDNTNAENSHHVVYMDGTSTPITLSTVLDGFTISAGNALDSGGGFYCDGSNGGECSPHLSNLVFSGNTAGAGGALYLNSNSGSSSPSLSNATFSGNTASSLAGALLVETNSGVSSPTLVDVNFIQNTAQFGGAVFNGSNDGISNPTLTDVLFSANTAVTGGALYNEATGTLNVVLTNITFSSNTASSMGGAIFHSQASTMTLNNATFSGNSAGSYGGAIYNNPSTATKGPTLSNVILWGDSAPHFFAGPEIYNVSSMSFTLYTVIDHSIVQGSHGSGAAWNTDFGPDGGGNLDADPLLGALQNNGGYTSTMLPATGSPAIDAGNDATCATTDQRGVTRPQGAHCDIGAVEVDRIFADNFEGTPTL